MIQQLGGEFGDVNNSGWCYWRPWMFSRWLGPRCCEWVILHERVT